MPVKVTPTPQAQACAVCGFGPPRAPSWLSVVTRLTSYPLRFSNTSALAPCLPHYCFGATPLGAEVTIPRVCVVAAC